MEGIYIKFTEQQLKNYAKPLSETEDKQCLNAIRMVRDALKELGFTDDYKSIKPLYEDTYSYSVEMRSLNGLRNIRLFIQGSYANNTNVRTESDVDIAVIQEEEFQTIFRTGATNKDYQFTNAPAKTKSFKDEVQECLENRFGDDVERKNKSIKINGNNYRKDADAVPCIRYRDYRQDYFNDVNNYIGGIVIKSDDGERIINYPEQHIENGKKKNNETNHYYKKMVRIMKKMRYLMKDYSYISAQKVSSFGLESLLWNIPNSIFTKYSTYKYAFEEIINYIYNDLYSLCNYKEANGIKPLCANQSDIENYKNFIIDLKKFYQYDI